MQSVKLPAGRYVVAVSGGVDSMVLLDMVRQLPGVEVLVAHVNHGLRADADEDERLVAHYAMSHNIAYAATRLQLSGVSEAEARRARYLFLRRCCKEFKACAIVLGHHEDDQIETALLNYIRGTGWRGLAPFAGSTDLLRPLGDVPKHQLIAYARAHNVPWREDSTNRDETYTRNHIRHTLVPTLDQKSDTWRYDFLQHLRKQQTLRRTIEREVAELFEVVAGGDTSTLPRAVLITLPRSVALELLGYLIRLHTSAGTPRPLLERGLLFAKVGRAGKVFQLDATWQLRATTRQIIVERRSPVVS